MYGYDPTDYTKFVRRGVTFLDDTLGDDWVHKIDLNSLQLSSCCNCVLGQLAVDIGTKVTGDVDVLREMFGDLDDPVSDDELRDLMSYSELVGERGQRGDWPTIVLDQADAVTHGFTLPMEEPDPQNWRDLTDQWKATITALREVR